MFKNIDSLASPKLQFLPSTYVSNLLESHFGNKLFEMPKNLVRVCQTEENEINKTAKIIADRTGIALEEIYGVVSFYAQFKLNPDGEVAVAVCLGTACYVKGSGDIIEECSRVLNVPVGSTSSDGRYSLEATRCIGACGLAPVLTINGEVYGRLTKDDIPGILAKYM